MNKKGNPETLKHFSKDYQPKKNGRKPSRLKKFIKENDIGASDISAIIKNIIFEKNLKELQTIIMDDSQPMLIRLFIKAFLDDYNRGQLQNIEKLMDRAIGKVMQKQEIDVNAKVGFSDEFKFVDASSE